MTNKDRGTRFTIYFSPEVSDEVGVLAKTLETSKAGVICKALGTLNYLVRHQSDGWKIVVEKDNVRKEIVTL